jgi:hypothetical protein
MLLSALLIAGVLSGSPETAPAQDLVHHWSQGFGDVSNDAARAIAIDPSGNIIAAGAIQGTVDFGGGPLTSAGAEDAYVVQFDPGGNHRWSRRFGDSMLDWTADVAVDTDGNVVATGSFLGTADFGGDPLTSDGQWDMFLVRYTPDGQHLWSQRFGDSAIQSGYGVACGPSGDIVVTGRFSGAIDFGGGSLESQGPYDIFVVLFDSSGTHQWSRRFGDVYDISHDESGSSIAFDPAGNILVTGSFVSSVDFGGGPLTSPGQDLFLAKLSSTGDHLWSMAFGAYPGRGEHSNVSASGPDSPPHARYPVSEWSAVAVDQWGNVHVSGFFIGAVDFGGGPLSSNGSQDVFLAKLDGNGNYLWSASYGGANYDRGWDIAVNSDDAIAITGEFLQTIDFGGGPITVVGGSDIFIASFDSNGNHLTSRGFGSAMNDIGYCIAAGGSGSTAGAGSFSSTIDFGGAPLTSVGLTDIYVASFELSSNGIENAATPPMLADLYRASPNPLTAWTRIRYRIERAEFVSLVILDVQGRHVRKLVDGMQAPRAWGFDVVWDGTDDAGRPMSSGVYFYRLEIGDRSLARKLVMVR